VPKDWPSGYILAVKKWGVSPHFFYGCGGRRGFEALNAVTASSFLEGRNGGRGD
jgi:hypothetical protein